MIIEIGARIWFQADGEPLEVVNIRINEYGQEPTVYFDNGGDMPASFVFKVARRLA